MAKKVFICLSLFFLMLAGGFMLNRQESQSSERQAAENRDGRIQVQQLENNSALGIDPQQIFAPREYVKIIQIKGE
ncbi:hypothetical protein AB1K84_14170 [Mesobacillus foraminis]|uniref:hypothetical protein n=1 Tax=Mesobacillus foraminis TaxID=279826 RepID=UPI0039A1D23A